MLQMQEIMINPDFFNDFRKHQGNDIKIFSSKCKNVIKDGKFSRSEI